MCVVCVCLCPHRSQLRNKSAYICRGTADSPLYIGCVTPHGVIIDRSYPGASGGCFDREKERGGSRLWAEGCTLSSLPLAPSCLPRSSDHPSVPVQLLSRLPLLGVCMLWWGGFFFLFLFLFWFCFLSGPLPVSVSVGASVSCCVVWGVSLLDAGCFLFPLGCFASVSVCVALLCVCVCVCVCVFHVRSCFLFWMVPMCLWLLFLE